MIQTLCPKCDTPLMGPDEYAGKNPRCPTCRAKVPAEKKAERPALIEEILASAQAPSAASGASMRSVERKARPGAQAPDIEDLAPHRRSYMPWLVTGAGVAAIFIAGFLMVRYARHQSALNRRAPALEQVKAAKDAIRRDEQKGKASLDRKSYREAKEAYESALASARGVQTVLASAIPGLREDETGDLKAAAAEMDKEAARLEAIVKSDPIQKGSLGWLEFDGRWVSKEDYDRLYAEKMKAEGKVLYDGQWITEEESWKRRGYVRYGEQWVTQQQYAALMEKEAERKRAAEDKARAENEAAAARRAALEAARQAALDARRAAAEELARRFPPGKDLWTVADFSQSNDCQACNWPNANAVVLQIVKRDGRSVLHVSTEGGAHDKIAFRMRVPINDWSSRSQLTLDVESTATSNARLAIALETDTFYESRPKTIHSGQNKMIAFDLNVGDFKSAPNWQHNVTVNQRDYVRFVNFVVYFAGKGDFYIDNVYLKK